jgi:PAS domain S-box-containing protein
MLNISEVRAVAELIPHVVWMGGPDGTTHFLNQQGLDLTGASPDLAGWDWALVCHPDDRDGLTSSWRQASEDRVVFEFEHRVRVADGGYRWMKCRGRPLLAESGEVMAWIGTWTDIDDARRLQERLLETQQETSELLAVTRVIEATAPIATAFLDTDLRIVRMNEMMTRVHGVSAESAIGKTVEELVPELWPAFEPFYRHVLDHGEPVVNLDVVPDHATGHPASSWLVTYYPVVRDDEMIGVGVVGVDISAVKEAEDFRAVLLDTMAEGLYAVDSDGRVTLVNRAAERLLGWTEQELLGRNAHESIHFQRPDGTTLPKHDCALLKVRTTGRAVRMSDDAFTHKDGTIIPVAYTSAPLADHGGARGAVVVFRDATEEHKQQSAVQRELDSLAWLGRIRDAMDDDRLLAYTQPIVHFDGSPDSEELLVRMITPTGDIALPAAFLPVAERYGLVGEIDKWMIRQGALRAATGTRVEINLSAWTISNVDILPVIEHELQQAGADPANLVVEITETSLMKDYERGMALARGLADLGCQIALDDFGTGFGSFTYLKNLPVSILKIDIEFVRDLPSVQANQHLVRAVVSLAKAFGLQTIAEGVEDQATLELLRDYDVDAVQGYHLGRPGPLTHTRADRERIVSAREPRP